MFIYIMIDSFFFEHSVRYTVRDINSSLCTHLVYDFIEIDPHTLEIENPYYSIPSTPIDTYEDFVDIRKKNSQLKVMVSLNVSTNKLPLVTDVLTIRNMVGHVIDFLRYYDFDGVVLDLYTSWIGKTSILDLVEPFGKKLRQNRLLFGARFKGVAGN